jgi:NAD(P)-dependent dehydrogenase (short-subunit alcohol dehydrogenase family)
MAGPLAGKAALVTGARGGIGAATARALAEAGATVAVCGRKPGDGAAAVAAIEAAGGKAFDHALDVGDLGAVKARIAAAAERLGRLDVIVNNAGVIEPMAPLAAIDPLSFDAALRVNVSGPAAVIAAAWPWLMGGGRVVNLLSGAAVRPLSGWAAYCASKAALLMLTQSVELEGAPAGLHCFGLAPGLVDTGMQAAIRAAHINAISDIPRERLSGPESAARAIGWLASGAGDDLAGTMIDVRDADFRRRAGLVTHPG